MTGGGYESEVRAGASIVIWWAVVIALAFGLWPRAPIPRAALVTGMCLGGLALMTGLSMAWASDDGRAFTELVRVFTYLGLFVAVILATSPGSARSWLSGLAVGLAALGAISLLSRLQPELFPTPEVAELIPDARQRLNYPLNYWNGLGACLGIGISLLAWLAAVAETRRARSIAAALIPVLGLALFLTSSRGAIAALALAIAVLLAADRRRVEIASTLVLGGIGSAVLIALTASFEDLVDGAETAAARTEGDTVLVAAILVVLATGGLRALLDGPLRALRVPSPPRGAAIAVAALALVAAVVLANPLQRIQQFTEPPPRSTAERGLITTHLTSVSGNGRYQYWEQGVAAFASSPLTGVGAGGYESWWGEHATLQLFVRDAHSLPVETLAELGIVGLLLVIGFLAVPLVAGIRARRDELTDSARAAALAVLAAGILSAAIDWMWELPAAFVPTLVAAALLSGPALGRLPRRATSRFGFGLLTLLAGWVAILAAAAALFTDVKIDASKDAVDRGDLVAAADAARDARALQPWAAAPRLQEALVEELRGDLPAARSALDAAIARSPRDWQVWFVDARLRARTNDLTGSLRSTGRLNRLKPEVQLVDRSGS